MGYALAEADGSAWRFAYQAGQGRMVAVRAMRHEEAE